jgi:hypothetical protein
MFIEREGKAQYTVNESPCGLRGRLQIRTRYSSSRAGMFCSLRYGGSYYYLRSSSHYAPSSTPSGCLKFEAKFQSCGHARYAVTFGSNNDRTTSVSSSQEGIPKH